MHDIHHLAIRLRRMKAEPAFVGTLKVDWLIDLCAFLCDFTPSGPQTDQVGMKQRLRLCSGRGYDESISEP